MVTKMRRAHSQFYTKFIDLKLPIDFKHFNQLFLIAVQNFIVFEMIIHWRVQYRGKFRFGSQYSENENYSVECKLQSSSETKAMWFPLGFFTF